MIIDTEARQQALHPAKSFIVQAPAGSGKTGLLVYRFLTLLARVDKPQSVLAITFTRKARSEMRERVLALMEMADTDVQSDAVFEQQGVELAREVLQRDKQLDWRLLAAPHQLQILTIDAFSARLAASMPWLSRLGDRPRTTDSAEAHYAVAVEQLLDELLNEGSEVSEPLQTVMYELDFNYDKARKLFGSMLAKRDQWLRHLVQNDMPSMRHELERAWQTLVDESIAHARGLFAESSLEALLKLAVNASQQIDYNATRAAKAMHALTDFTGGIKDLQIQHWLALRSLLLVSDGKKFRAKPDKNTGFPSNNDAKRACTELLEESREDSALLKALAELGTLPKPYFSDADWQRLIALEQVLKALAVRLQLRFRAVGECDHSEVTQRANLALSELNEPTDLGLLMDGQIHHILVDEFQDTSNGQLSLLKKLTAGWDENEETNQAQAKTLFLVGDPMQSIYRFREADVSLFLQVANNAQTRVFDNLRIHSLTLSQNFRSSKSLVEWFNGTFDDSFPIHSEVLTGAINYSHAHSSKDDGNLTPVRYCLANDKQQEAEHLLQAAQQAIAELPDDKAQVAILVRTRPQLEYLLPLLDEHNIAYAAVDIQSLHEQQAIIDAIALCKAICREEDRIAWLALLRGPWCGLSLSEIHRLTRAPDRSIWQQISQPSALIDGLDADAKARLHRFSGIMREALSQCQQVDLGSLTRWAWAKLGGPETLGDTSQDDLNRLFAVLDNLQRGGDLPSGRELENALQGLRATNVQVEQPKLLVSTIHKSKGLQYHTVILPGLANPPRSDDREILMWAEHQDHSGQTNLLLAPLLFNPESGSHYDYLRKLDTQRAHNEVMRLMYVASTRAEKRLVLIGRAARSEKTGAIMQPRAGSLLNTVWAALEDEFELPPANDSESVNDEVTALDQTLQRIPADYRPELPDNIKWSSTEQLNALETDLEQIDYDWATEVATGVGIILHDFLQFSGSKVLTLEIDEGLRQRWRAELLALHVRENRVDYALQRLVRTMRNIQGFQQAHFIFADYALQHNEYALSTVENGMVNKYRIDRTFVDDAGVRWIVDYKSTFTDNENVAEFVDIQVAERHAKQLQKYGDLISQLEARPIKLVVYFPLLKQMRVWDYSPS